MNANSALTMRTPVTFDFSKASEGASIPPSSGEQDFERVIRKMWSYDPFEVAIFLNPGEIECFSATLYTGSFAMGRFRLVATYWNRPDFHLKAYSPSIGFFSVPDHGFWSLWDKERTSDQSVADVISFDTLVKEAVDSIPAERPIWSGDVLDRSQLFQRTLGRLSHAKSRTCTHESCQCTRQVGKHWTFINCASTKCGAEWGLYVAVYQADPNAAVNYGFFAVVEVAINFADYPFDAFIQDIINQNGTTTYLPHSSNVFKFPPGRGPDIQFIHDPMNRLRYPIEAIAGQQQQTDLTKWPLANGQLFDAGVVPQAAFIVYSWERHGCVTIDNPARDERLILDLSNAQQPRRALLQHSNTGGCDCPLQPQCDQDF